MNSNETENRSRRPCRRWMIPFFIAAFVLVKSVVVFFLWNALIPDLFQGPILNFPQAIGLVVLAKVLLGFGGGPRGFGGHPGFGGPRGFMHRRDHRWKHMSSEEREKLRQELRNRC